MLDAFLYNVVILIFLCVFQAFQQLLPHFFYFSVFRKFVKINLFQESLSLNP